MKSENPFIEIITNTSALEVFCAEASSYEFVTVDTEFFVRTTYYPKLCLIQVGYGDTENGRAVLIDPLAGNLSLAPLCALFNNSSVIKVFHAARQDLEILSREMKTFPYPLFDTQIAAMVCGFGAQISYEKLAKHFANAEIDKANRVTDWSKRPLSKGQLNYALADVTHLRDVYRGLVKLLDKNGRKAWIDEETASLINPKLYEKKPDQAWMRLKYNARSKGHHARVMYLAALREREAQTRNLSRNFILRDEEILEIAINPSKKALNFKKYSFSKKYFFADFCAKILQAIAEAEALSSDQITLPERKAYPHKDAAIAQLLRVLLKVVAGRENVADILIASAGELDMMAMGLRDMRCLTGWRLDIFGRYALGLCAGNLALGAKNGEIKLIELVENTT